MLEIGPIYGLIILCAIAACHRKSDEGTKLQQASGEQAPTLTIGNLDQITRVQISLTKTEGNIVLSYNGIEKLNGKIAKLWKQDDSKKIQRPASIFEVERRDNRIYLTDFRTPEGTPNMILDFATMEYIVPNVPGSREDPTPRDVVFGKIVRIEEGINACGGNELWINQSCSAAVSFCSGLSLQEKNLLEACTTSVDPAANLEGLKKLKEAQEQAISSLGNLYALEYSKLVENGTYMAMPKIGPQIACKFEDLGFILEKCETGFYVYEVVLGNNGKTFLAKATSVVGDRHPYLRGCQVSDTWTVNENRKFKHTIDAAKTCQ